MKNIRKMRRSILFVCFLLSALVLTSCSDNTTGFHSEAIFAEVTDNGIQVFNNADVPVYYFAVEEGTLALLSWAPVSSEENKIDAESNKTIPFTDIIGSENGNRIILYYWQKIEPSMDDIHDLVIDTDN
ncbi:MAG: hypothetical protein WD355_08020 [Balneolaceae bacterium]